MEYLLAIAFALVALFVLGKLAAWAVPGPDPMPAWLTILIGFGAAVTGGGIGYNAGGPIAFVAGATVAGAILIVLYRRVFQRRGISGAEAQRYPTRGFGVGKIRSQLGIDAPAASRERQLAYLESLRDDGVLTEQEYAQKRELVLARDR